MTATQIFMTTSIGTKVSGTDTDEALQSYFFEVAIAARYRSERRNSPADITSESVAGGFVTWSPPTQHCGTFRSRSLCFRLISRMLVVLSLKWRIKPR